MNILTMKLKNEHHPFSVHIENDDEAGDAYFTIGNAIDGDRACAVTINGVHYNFAKSSIQAISLVESCVYKKEQQKLHELQAREESQLREQSASIGAIGVGINPYVTNNRLF